MTAPDAARFDRLAPTYDQTVPFFATFGERLVEWVGVRRGQRVLDLGAGRGAVTCALSAALGPSADIVAGDVSTEMLAHLRALGSIGAEVKYLDATDIDEPDRSFDVVFSAYVLHFLAARAQALGEVARVLRPAGTFAMSVPGSTESTGWWKSYARITDELRSRTSLAPRDDVQATRWPDLAEAAGLQVVEHTTLQVVLPLESTEQHWQWLLTHSHRGLYEALDGPGRKELRDRVMQSLRDAHPTGGMHLIREADFYRMSPA